MEDKKKTIEDMLGDVDEIIEKLDSGEIPLEDSFKIYEKGMQLIKTINSKIDKVEKKIIQIDADAADRDDT